MYSCAAIEYETPEGIFTRAVTIHDLDLHIYQEWKDSHITFDDLEKVLGVESYRMECGYMYTPINSLSTYKPTQISLV